MSLWPLVDSCLKEFKHMIVLISQAFSKGHFGFVLLDFFSNNNKQNVRGGVFKSTTILRVCTYIEKNISGIFDHRFGVGVLNGVNYQTSDLVYSVSKYVL